MVVAPTITLSPEQHFAQDKPPTKRWLPRQLLRPVPRQDNPSGERSPTTRHTLLRRPRTAPSTGPAAMEIPPLPRTAERRLIREPTQDLMQTPELDLGVVRNVNAWLDSSSKPAPPLMGGLPYWRDGSRASVADTGHTQYAIPVLQEPNDAPPSTSHSEQLRSLCRRAKRMQVRMPSMRRTGSQRTTVRKQINRRSVSTPLLAMPYEQTPEGSPPTFFTRIGSSSRPSVRPATATAPAPISQIGGWTEARPMPPLDLPLRHYASSARFGGSECSMERHVNAVFGQTRSMAENRRAVMAADRMPREDSMGSMSDAPTYFTGPPPPSYRSRAASILSTSSFGCVDGMSSEQRQISQQRAQKKRGIKGTLRKMAQKARLAK